MKVVVLLFLLAFVSTCVPAHADTYTVPSTDPYGIVTSALTAGQTYVITSSGYYYWDSYGVGDWADADWFYSINYPTNPNQYADPSDPSYKLFGLLIDYKPVTWEGLTESGYVEGAFSPDHVYRTYYTGTGVPVTLSIADTYPYSYFGGYEWASDNIGSIDVDVSPVPEPSSLCAMLAGIGGLLPAGVRKIVRRKNKRRQ